MYTLIFDLDYEKMERDGITEADMLEPMREHARKYGIEETRKGVFSMDEEKAMCALMIFVIDIEDKDTSYIRYLKTWKMVNERGYEDCKEETIKYYKEEGIEYLD